MPLVSPDRRLLFDKSNVKLFGESSRRHFTPPYAPWDQRLCVCPAGDFQLAYQRGAFDIVTAHIDHIQAGGICLKPYTKEVEKVAQHNGEKLPLPRKIEADLIVMATGLSLRMLGGIKCTVDGEKINSGEKVMFRNTMLDGVPNAYCIIGYAAASWTLKVDILCQDICRVINAVDARKGAVQACPYFDGDRLKEVKPFFELMSGYVKRSPGMIPKQGIKFPWAVSHDYYVDAWESAMATAIEDHDELVIS